MSSSSTPCSAVAGSFLYWHDWHTYPSFGDWIGSNFGVSLTVGALLAISGLVVAATLTRPTIARLVPLGQQVAASGGPPTPETAARIAALQRRLVVAERVSFSLVLLAVVAMASARYI
jgi:energy-converting hydrogenase Eha subunit A